MTPGQERQEPQLREPGDLATAGDRDSSRIEANVFPSQRRASSVRIPVVSDNVMQALHRYRLAAASRARCLVSTVGDRDGTQPVQGGRTSDATLRRIRTLAPDSR